MSDQMTTLLVLITALLFVVMTYIPLAQRLFEIMPLRLPEHYLAIGLAVAAWALGLRFLLLVIPLEGRVRSTFTGAKAQNTMQTGVLTDRSAT